jgi:hypothetical protein
MEMADLAEKISSYNIFNNLLPGAVFIFASGRVASLGIPQENFLALAFVYYFIGMVISRFGSLIVEPILRKTSFLKFAPYQNYIRACKLDPKIDSLSEVNNTYRTLTAMCILLLLLKLFESLRPLVTCTKNEEITIIIILLFLLFEFSHRKQTSFITKRIESAEK